MSSEIEIDMYTRLNKIEHEIEAMKVLVLRTPESPREIISLGGLLKGLKITDDDIKKAKQSLFMHSV